MERLEKYQYLGLMWSGTKAGMFTCLNTPTGHATAVKQAIVVHVVTHTSTYMEPHIPNIKNIGAVLDIYPEENNLKALTHQRHGNDPWTRVVDGSTPITNRDWNSCFLNNEENKSCSLSAAHIFPRLAWAECSYWVSASRPNNVTSQDLSIATIHRRIPVHDT